MFKFLTTALLVLATLSLSSVALAASPHDGAWKLVESKSNWSNGKFPKGMSLTINLKFEDNKIEYHSVNDTRPTKLYKVDYVTTLDGKPSPLNEQERFNKIAVSKTGEDTYQILKMKDEDVVVGEFWTFYPDGKTLIRRGVGKSPEGISKAYTEYFERQ
jgi:hypothetical protein